MLRAVLVDDEMPSLDALEQVLAKSGAVQVAGKYTDPLEGLENIRQIKAGTGFYGHRNARIGRVFRRQGNYRHGV